MLILAFLFLLVLGFFSASWLALRAHNIPQKTHSPGEAIKELFYLGLTQTND